MDQWGKVRRRGRGTLLDRLFGGWVDVVHDARANPMTVDGMSVEGFYGDLMLTRARPVAVFGNGRPAVSENRLGRGAAVLIAFDPARLCWKPGRSDIERWLGQMYRGGRERRWWSDAPMVVRRSSPGADHWFIINDGPARDAELCVHDRTYRSGVDVLSGERVQTGGSVALRLPERSGLWLRFARIGKTARRG
jgi:beta-galactosidase